MKFGYNKYIYFIAVALSHISLTACGVLDQDPVVSNKTGLYDSPVPKVEKQKVGKPYQIKGIWYKPEINNGYDEIGIASWYGPGFHGRSTSNGEIFDENKVSAAHKTLPLPSYVEVTNLDNGKQLYIRVNDRGPFADDRIIDLSKRAAEILGSKSTGLARVRVRMAQPPKNITLLAPNGQTIVGKGYKPAKQYASHVESQKSPAPTPPRYNNNSVVAPVIQQPLQNQPIYQTNQPYNQQPYEQNNNLTPTPIEDYLSEPNHSSNQQNLEFQSYAVRVGMFGNPENVARLEKELAPHGIVTIKSVERNGGQLSEVSLVGYKSQQEASDVAHQLNNIGIHNALVVSE